MFLLLFVIPAFSFAARWKTVKYVIDGDTIITGSSKWIRLLSINAPEIAYKGKAEESGGDEAKAWLKSKLRGQNVFLEKNAQHYDEFGRTLAFIFNE